MNNALMLADAGATVSTSLTTIATQITSTIGEVAPTGIGIAGLFLVWKFGMRFFKSVAK